MADELSDEEVFGSAAPRKELSDAEVFGGKELSDEEVFGKPKGPGVLEYGKEVLKQVGVGGIESAVPMYLRGVGQDRPLPGEMESIVAPTVPEGTMPPPPTPEARPLSETPSYQLAEKISKAIGSDQPSPILHPVVTDIARGVGSVASSIVTSPIGGPIMAARGEAAQTAIAKGATPEEQAKAQNLGEIAGATDFADLLLLSTGGTGKALGLIAKIGKPLLEKAFIEGGQEGFQQFIQNMISKGVYKPDQDVFENVPYSAFLGAVVGGGVGAVGGALSKSGAGREATEQDIQAATAAVTAPPPTAAPAVPVPTTPPRQSEQDILAGIEGAFAEPVKGLTPEAAIGAESQPISVGVPLDVKPQLLELEPQVEPEPGAFLSKIQGRMFAHTGEQIPGESRKLAVETSRGVAAAPVVLTTHHSTTLNDILPFVTTSHLEGKPINAAILNGLKRQLMQFVPDMPLHVISEVDMKRLGYQGTAGLYYPRLKGANTGPILISSKIMWDKVQATHTILHEATHAVTSNVMLSDPVVAARSLRLMEEAKKYLPPVDPFIGKKPYWTTNEREFIAEAFSNTEFQDYLAQHSVSRELARELNLEGTPTMWEAFVEMVRQVLGLPRTRENMSLLEAVIRTGIKTMQTQQRQLEAMQRSFDKVEPGLRAVPRTEETRPIYDMISGLSDHIPGDLKPEFMRQAGYADKVNVFYRYMTHAFQLGELNPRLAPFQRYLEKMRAAAVDESKWNDAAMRVMKDWENIGRQQSEGLTGFIDDITNMVYRTQAEVQAGVGRKPTPQEAAALARKYKLNTAALDVFTKINKLFDGFLDASAQLAIAEASKITDLKQRNTAIAAVQANVASLKSRPYFPFMRYGRHVVLVRNKAGHVVHREHFERRGTKSAEAFQKEALARAQKAFPAPQYRVEIDLLSESTAPMVGMSNIMLDLMQQKLKLTAQQTKALEQLKFELSPAQSFKHRFQHKSYVKGYSRDFQRSFAQYFFHGAKWYAKVKYADGMRQDIADVKAGAMTSLTPTKRLQLSDFMNDHIENNFLNPSQDFITFKAGLVFYTLAYTPVSAVVNLSQTPMVTLPFLAGKFGPVQAGRSLAKAIGTMSNFYRKGTLANMTSDDAKALDYAVQTGRLDQTLGAELAAWGQGSNLGVGYGGGTIRRNIHGAVQKGMWMFSIAEKANRRVAFMAARDLALRQPNNKFRKDALTRYHDELTSMLKAGFPQHEAEAILVASHVVDQTQFMATPESRPRFMRGKFGTLFLYKRFIQGLLFLTLNNKRDFMPWFIVVALGMGGLGGVPGYEDLKEIAKALGWWLFGKDFDLDREIRKLVREMTDESWAPDQILHGSARTGFGVPWLLNMLGNAAGQSPTVNQQTGQPQGPDMSASLSSTILPVKVGQLFGPPIADPSKAFGEQAAQAAGVMGGLAYNMYKAMASKDQPGDFKKWEAAMPRFAKNLSHSYRAFSEGMEKGSTGAAIIRYDTRDPEHLGEILALAGGFQPRRLTAKWEELREQSEVIKFYDLQRNMILQQWAAAVKAGREPEEIEKVRLATQEFNKSLPYEARGKALSSKTIEESVRARLRSQELQEGGLAAQKGNIPLIQEMQRLHPESVIDVRKVR